jgi:hypothetical protein
MNLDVLILDVELNKEFISFTMICDLCLRIRYRAEGLLL